MQRAGYVVSSPPAASKDFHGGRSLNLRGVLAAFRLQKGNLKGLSADKWPEYHSVRKALKAAVLTGFYPVQN